MSVDDLLREVRALMTSEVKGSAELPENSTWRARCANASCIKFTRLTDGDLLVTSADGAGIIATPAEVLALFDGVRRGDFDDLEQQLRAQVGG